jgi:hypothetical protein
MGKHVAVLGFIHLILGALAALGGVLVLIFGLGSGMLAVLVSEDAGRAGFGLLGLVGGALGIVVLLNGLLGVLTGYGLLARRGWGRILGVISSVLFVLHFSWTSLFGIYGLWVLLSKEGAREFTRPR